MNSIRLAPAIELANAALGFLFPEACQLCQERRAGPGQGYVCGECWQGVRFVTEPFCERCGLPFEGDLTTRFECGNCREMELHFTSARASVRARGPALEVIHRYKYQQALWFEPFLVDLLLRVVEPAFRAEPFDLLVPVPLHPVRKREREFNQAERLARGVGRRLGVNQDARLLQRLVPTPTQTLLSRRERAENVRHAFAVRAGGRLDGRRVALIDDVLTTGATASACARALLRAGASDVRVFTVARAVGDVR